MYSEEIVIGAHVHITMNTIILDATYNGIKWQRGHVEICDNAFIGTWTIICNSVKIGTNSIVGAGSVVTKDIPDMKYGQVILPVS